MKKTIYHSLLLAAIIPFTTMCSKENKQAEVPQPDSLEASVAAQEDEKVSFTQGDGKLTLAWEAGDQLRVSGTTSEVYTIMEGFSGHKASFEGNTVKGTSFDIFYPASYATKDAIMGRTYTGQVQNGNGNSEHLEYNALIEGASDYHVVVFDKSQPNVKLNGVLKLVVKMPAGISGVKSISLSAPSAIFYNDNAGSVTTDNIGISFSEGTTVDANSKVTAYIMTSMKDVTVAAGTKLTIKVTIPEKGCYYAKTFSNPSAISLNGGETLKIDISDLTVMKHKVGGAGTQASPYELWDKEDVELISTLFASSGTTYFKMMADIDMDGYSWTVLTPEGEHKIDFDGNGKTLSNIVVEGAQKYPSLFGVLDGSVHDASFDKITVTQAAGKNYGMGIIASFVGNQAGTCEGLVKNVNISNSSVTYDSNGASVGGVCGSIGKGSIENVTIDSNTTVSQNITGNKTKISAMGGIAGCTRYAGAVSIKGCKCYAKVESKTSIVLDTSANFAVGGIIGKIGHSSDGDVVESCLFNGTLSVNAGSYIGGVVGLIYPKTGCTVTKCVNKAAIPGTSANNYVGGIVGYANRGVISKCYNTGKISGNEKVGGIVGLMRPGNSTTRNLCEDCYNTGEVYVVKQFGGGIAGAVENYGTVQRCWSTGKMSEGRGLGGVIGQACGDNSTDQRTDESTHYYNCFYSLLAYPASITSKGSTGNYSSGAIIGHTTKYFTANACYRSASVADNFTCDYKPSKIALIGNQGYGVTSSTGLTSYIGDGTSTDQKNWFPYHGNAVGSGFETIAPLVRYINSQSKFAGEPQFSTDVWDIPSGEGEPTLKNMPTE